MGFSLIILPDQEKWSGDGASIKAINGVDAVAIDPKYRDAYSTHIPEVIPAKERDPQLLNKISTELAVIVRHLMQRFSQPEGPALLQAQKTSSEAQGIKRQADPLVDFCGYLMPVSTPNGLFIGNANIRPMNMRRCLYHAYLSSIEARGHQHPMRLMAFGQAVPQALYEYEIELLKRKTKNGIQTNLELSEDCETDWLPRCDT